MQCPTSSRKILLLLAGLGLAAGAAGPATAQEPARAAQAEQAAPAEADRIRLVNVNGYSVIDREHLVLSGGPRHHYLVTLRHRCAGLNSGVRIATSFPATTTLYPPFAEYITVQDGPGSQRCHIDTIEAVDSVGAARLLVQARSDAEAEAEAGNTPSRR
jgi:hypothetical protein